MTTTTEPAAHSPDPRLDWAAQAYLLAVYVVAIAAFVLNRPDDGISAHDWRLALLFAALAGLAQLFVVVTNRDQSYHLTPGIVVAAAILLPPVLLAVVVVVQHIPEWLTKRYPWFIQTFNMANYGLSALAAARVFDFVMAAPIGSFARGDARFVLAGFAASVVFVLVMHLLLALVLKLARGHSLEESGLFQFHSLAMDGVLALGGVVLAALWESNPLLIPVALAPLFLLHRTLALPKLEAEARLDPKTDLFNARHFTVVLDEHLEQARREETPFALLVADLDLLREVNNRYGHLAGDVVIAGVAQTIRRALGPHDVAARFGGEEYCILLAGADHEEALVAADRIRAAVAAERFDVQTSSSPISATVSIGVACFPGHSDDAQDLLHMADVAAYHAKARGRNRVVSISGVVDEGESAAHDHAASEPARSLVPAVQPALAAGGAPPPAVGLRSPAVRLVPVEVPSEPPPALNLLALRPALRALIVTVAVAGVAAGLAAFVVDRDANLVALLVLVGLVAAGQALAIEVLDRGTISLSAVGSLAGAALFGPRAALPLAVAVCLVDWSAHRPAFHKLAFNLGTLTLSGLAGAAVFAVLPEAHWAFVVGGAAAGALYFVVNIGLLTTVIALETGEAWGVVIRGRFAWLFPHYLVYGVVAAMVGVAYDAAGLLGLFVFAVPLILVRKAQLDYITHTETSVLQLRQAAATIEQQNASLTAANTRLRDTAMEAMESLAAVVDARDSYTAGHSRRVQLAAVAIAWELGVDDDELESISYAALFHDIGKLAVPDSVLLKQGPLDEGEWWNVHRHPVEGERIIGHLGFLLGAAPAIRHHHERFDGKGYPDGLSGQDIPLGARVLHIADAFDSMISSRVYRPGLALDTALSELRVGQGTQFCPVCVAAFERALSAGALDELVRQAIAV